VSPELPELVGLRIATAEADPGRRGGRDQWVSTRWDALATKARSREV